MVEITDKVFVFIQTSDRVFTGFSVFDGCVGIFGEILGGKTRPAVTALIVDAIEARALDRLPGDLHAVGQVLDAFYGGGSDIEDGFAARIIAHEIFTVCGDHAQGIGVGVAGFGSSINILGFGGLCQTEPSVIGLAVNAIGLCAFCAVPCDLDPLRRIAQALYDRGRIIGIAPSVVIEIADEVIMSFQRADGIDAVSFILDGGIGVRGAAHRCQTVPAV